MNFVPTRSVEEIVEEYIALAKANQTVEASLLMGG